MAKYVDNKKFLVEITKYVELYNYKEQRGEVTPIMNDYLGQTFWDIASNFSNLRCFAMYKFRDEMISDAVFDMVRYAHKFNPEKSSNPLAYFTQVARFAFYRKIAKEKKMLYTKYKAINNSEIFGMLHTHSDADDKIIIDDVGYSEGAKENMYNFIKEYEEKQNK